MDLDDTFRWLQIKERPILTTINVTQKMKRENLIFSVIQFNVKIVRRNEWFVR